MASRDSFSVIKDSESGLIFSVIVSRDGVLNIFGNMTQGKEWANWAIKSGASKSEMLDTLDGSLYVGPELPFVKEEFASVEPLLTTKVADLLRGMLPAVIIKTEQVPLPGADADENLEEPEYETIVAFSAIDTALSLFDAQLKTIAVDYKAMQFLTKKKVASLTLAVKATKSVWRENGFGGSWKPLSRKNSSKSSGFSHLGGVGGKSVLRRTAMSIEQKAVKPFNPATARDADKDGLVGEGIPTINMGRGVPDPTPFGSRRLARRDSGVSGAVGAMGSRKRTSRLAQRLSSAATRISEAGGDRKPSEPRRAESETRRMTRRISDIPETDIIEAVSTIIEPRASAESTRTSRGGKPLVSRLVSRAGQRAAEKVESEQAPKTRRASGRIPRGDSESMRARAAERLRRLSDKLAGKPTPVTQPKSVPAEPKAKPKKVQATQPSARMRQVTISRTKPMRLLFGVTSPSYGPGKPLEDRDFSSYKPFEQQKILKSARQTLETYLSSWRSRLGVPDGGEVTEDSVLSYLDDQAKLGKNVFPLQVQAHNMMLLDDLVHDEKENPSRNRDVSWWNLKQNLRSELLKSTGVTPVRAEEQNAPVSQQVAIPPEKPRPTPRVVPQKAPEKPQTDGTVIPMSPEVRKSIMEAVKPFSGYDRTIASDRYATAQIPFSDYSPEEQRRIISAMDEVRREAYDVLENYLKSGTVIGEGSEAKPLLGRDEKLTPEKILAMLESEKGAILPFSGQLGRFGNDFYSLLGSVLAMDNMLGDLWTNVSRNRNEDFISIDDRVRGHIQRMAAIERRDLVPQRRVGATGERTVFARQVRRRDEPAVAEGTPKEQVQETTQERVAEVIQAQPQEAPTDVPQVVTQEQTPVTNRRTGQIISGRGVENSQLVKQVRTQDADGNEIFVEVSSLGDKGQYEHDNQHVDGNDNLFLMERSTQLFRNPITNEYLENYSMAGREVPVSVDSDIEHMPVLPKVRLAKSAGEIVSYPQIQLEARGGASSKYPSLVQLRARSKPGSYGRNTISKMAIISNALGISEAELINMAGGQNKKFYFAPNVADNGLSVSNWRQSLEIMLQVDDADLSGDFKQNFTTFDIVDAPTTRVMDDGTVIMPTAAEAYAVYVGRNTTPAEGMTLGETLEGVTLIGDGGWRPFGKGDKKFTYPNSLPDESIPKHMNPKNGSDWHIFEWSKADNEANNNNEITNGSLVPGVTKHGDLPLTYPKLLVAWHHPGKDKQRNWNSANWRLDADPVYNIVRLTNRAIISGSPEDWYRAYNATVSLYRDSVRQADTALSQWRKVQGARSRGKQPRRNFVVYSERAEKLEQLLADVFAPNISLIEQKIRSQKERNAKSYNAIAKARRVLASESFKNVGGLEERMLGPQLDENNNVVQRGAESLLDMVKMHHATGFLPHQPLGVRPEEPIVYSILTDAQINYLSFARLAYETFADPLTPNPELTAAFDSISGPDSTRGFGRRADTLIEGARKRMLTITLLRFSGYLDKPIRVSESELSDIMSEYPLRADSRIEGVNPEAEILKGMHVSPINRGISSAISFREFENYPSEFLAWWFGNEKSASEAASDLISGEYWVPGGYGGEAGGSGLNFYHAGANTYSYTAGEARGDKVIALIPTTARVINRSSLLLLNRHIVALADMVNALVARDSDQERDVPIDPKEFAPDPSLPNTYEGHFVPWGGLPATLDNNVVNRFSTADTSEEDFDTKREWARTVWKAVFGENPPATIDSGDAKALEGLLDKILVGLQTLPQRRDEKETRQDRGMYYNTNLADQRVWDYDLLNDAIFNNSESQSDAFGKFVQDKDLVTNTEWFKRTRAQVIGWYIQLEIAKGQAIAKAKAAGENPYNDEVRKIVRAQEALTIPNDEQLAAVIYGLDGYWADGETYSFSQLLNGNLTIGPLAFSTNVAALNAAANAGRQGQFLMVNRTAFIFLDRTLTASDVTSVINEMKLSGTNRNPYTR